MRKTKAEKLLWILVILAIVVIGTKKMQDSRAVTDVTGLVNASKATVEKTLGAKLVSNPAMAEQIFQYSSNGNVSVDGDSEKGVGIIYINGIQRGFYIENKKYSMYDVKMGNLWTGLRDRLTFSYEDAFEVGEDIDKELVSKRKTYPVFFYNRPNNDCVVAICDKASGMVVGLVYFNDLKKVTERLDFK